MVKLMTYGGTGKVPATMACIEMIRHDTISLIPVIEKTGIVTILCDALSECRRQCRQQQRNQQQHCSSLLMTGMIMAIQSILDEEQSFKNEDVRNLAAIGMARNYI